MQRRSRRSAAPVVLSSEPLESRVMLSAQRVAPAFAPAPGDLTDVNGTLFFTASDDVNGIELWRSDGTPAGTSMLRDIQPGPTGSTPNQLKAVGNTLFFVAYTLSSGGELWKSDGTPNGTMMLKDIWPGPGSSSISGLTNVNGRLFFSAFNGAGQSQIWQSDGTVAGTRVVTTASSNAVALAASGNRVYWRESTKMKMYDRGTGAITALRDFTSGPFYSTDINGTLYFSAAEATGGAEVWKASGATVSRVADLTPGPADTWPESLTNVNGTLMFWANNGQGKRGLWKSNGTASGTTFVKATEPFVNRAAAGGTLYFSSATSAANPGDEEVWKSDGTAAGTVVVRDIQPGTLGSMPAYYAVAGSSIYFVARDMVWRSDGTAAGTVPVARTNLTGSSFPLPPTTSGQYVYFGGSEDGAKTGLWRVTTQPGASVAGNVLNDRDGDAVRDAGENGLAGRVVYQDGDDDSLPDPTEFRTVTDDDGNYRLDGLSAGTYHVRLYLPAGWRQTAPAGAAAHVITLTASQAVTGRNFAAQGTPPKVVAARFGPVQSPRAVIFDFEANSGVLGSLGVDDLVVANRDTGQTVPASSIAVTSAISTLPGRSGAFNFANSVPAGRYHATLRASGVSDIDGYTLAADYVFDFTMSASVVGRRLFYNNSSFDGRNPAANAADDAAIAMDKAAMIVSPGRTTGAWGNYTTYSRGINGLMVDVAGLPGGAGPALSGDDFDLSIGNDPDPARWTAAPAPSGIDVRRGAGPGGADRIIVVWPDGAIRNTWLRVTIKATPSTGLTAPEVFFFGNYAGDVGPIFNPRLPPRPASFRPAVDAHDFIATRRAVSTAAAPVTSAFDFDRDGKITSADWWVVRRALYVEPLRFFTMPVA